MSISSDQLLADASASAAVQTKTQTILVGLQPFHIRSLKDKQQFFDPDGVAEQAGISSSTWPLFGSLWPSGLVLADIMQVHEIAGLRILEVGCGLGLASLVAHQRGADTTASDYHPISEDFMAHNVDLNAFLPLPFVICDYLMVVEFDVFLQNSAQQITIIGLLFDGMAKKEILLSFQ